MVWTISPAHYETAVQRANRDFLAALHRFRFYVFLFAFEAIGVAASAWFSDGHSKDARVLVGVLAFLAATAAAFGLLWLLLWAAAPIRQRNEARRSVLERPVALQMIDGLSELVVRGTRLRKDVDDSAWDRIPTQDQTVAFLEWKLAVARYMATNLTWTFYAGFAAADSDLKLSDGRMERAQLLGRWNAHLGVLNAAIAELRGRMN